MKFHSPSKRLLELPDIVKEIAAFIQKDSSRRYSIIVGTDSYPSNSVDYVTAIVVHRQGRGGRYFWSKKHDSGKTPTLRHRMYKEAQCSIQIAQKLIPKLHNKKLAGYDFEIHVDIGSAGPTKDMINEIVGMIKGYGYIAKTKPESYAASTVADRYT